MMTPHFEVGSCRCMVQDSNGPCHLWAGGGWCPRRYRRWPSLSHRQLRKCARSRTDKLLRSLSSGQWACHRSWCIPWSPPKWVATSCRGRGCANSANAAHAISTTHCPDRVWCAARNSAVQSRAKLL